jgi:hypothetical protein
LRPTGRRLLDEFKNIRITRFDNRRAILDIVDVSERVLDLHDFSVEV